MLNWKVLELKILISSLLISVSKIDVEEEDEMRNNELKQVKIDFCNIVGLLHSRHKGSSKTRFYTSKDNSHRMGDSI